MNQFACQETDRTTIKTAMKGLTSMRQTGRPGSARSQREKKPLPFTHRVREISEKVKVIRFGVVRKTTESPWSQLAGMFVMSEPVRIEEILHARGDEETAEAL